LSVVVLSLSLSLFGRMFNNAHLVGTIRYILPTSASHFVSDGFDEQSLSKSWTKRRRIRVKLCRLSSFSPAVHLLNIALGIRVCPGGPFLISKISNIALIMLTRTNDQHLAD